MKLDSHRVKKHTEMTLCQYLKLMVKFSKCTVRISAWFLNYSLIIKYTLLTLILSFFMSFANMILLAIILLAIFPRKRITRKIIWAVFWSCLSASVKVMESSSLNFPMSFRSKKGEVVPQRNHYQIWGIEPMSHGGLKDCCASFWIMRTDHFQYKISLVVLLLKLLISCTCLRILGSSDTTKATMSFILREISCSRSLRVKVSQAGQSLEKIFIGYHRHWDRLGDD